MCERRQSFLPPVASLDNVTVVEGDLIDAHEFDVPRLHLTKLTVFG